MGTNESKLSWWDIKYQLTAVPLSNKFMKLWFKLEYGTGTWSYAYGNFLWISFFLGGGGQTSTKKNLNGLKCLKRKRFYQVSPVFLPHLTIIASHFLIKLVCCLPCNSPPLYNHFLTLTCATCLLWLNFINEALNSFEKSLDIKK